MATYKRPCMHCNTLIDSDARFCPSCSSMSPFIYLCPTCLRPIEKGQVLCCGCGRELYIVCPACKKKTFVQERCEECHISLMIRCENRRCGVAQFFQNTKCTACGKKIKHRR